ncbi:hypothetical protein QTP70_026503 [Hemibagrus guttatus]|uniref:Cytochrome P450 n=1 Tax=Hemibagrus guttatus TaxID=175788 RepID=A0AAE0R1T3_9TELE|nr:hypothetical protein QTP70_026503 [Hemibagrus guttatus]
MMMIGSESGLVSAILAFLRSVVPVLLLLAVSRRLWSLRWSAARDKACALPLPEGSMGWPLIGETFHWLFQGSSFHISRREKHGNVFKTHLLGKPVIRVTGAENIRKILLGEHTLVSTQWPQSTRIILGPNTLVNSVSELHKKKRKILAKVFSQAALESYLTRLQDVVKGEISKWCTEAGPVEVYTATRSLTFRIAVRVLLGLKLEERRITHLSKTFEQLMNNLFSLPVDAPLSGLRKGKKARDILHAEMENIIKEKLKKQNTDEYCDAFDYMLSAAKENDYNLTMQELKGYQIPKGWSVMYSIRDTHETSSAYTSPELFDPERFTPDRDESKTSRFSYVPFGGGVRRCIGRELALLMLKTLSVELLATSEWTLATETYPSMQTVPIVHPVNGLHVHFKYRNHSGGRNHRECTHI